MDYGKNLDLNDIVYFCEFDLIWKTEQWKDIKDYEGSYMVSDLGRVKSLDRIDCKGRIRFGLILSQCFGRGGYYIFRVCLKSKAKTLKVHQSVAMAFLNHKPCAMKLVINHKNFIRTDNRTLNLEIITSRENTNKKHLKSTSKYVGVFFDNRAKKWSSNIYINKKRKHLGCFDYEIEAHNYYQAALRALLDNKEIIVKKNNYHSKFKGVTWNIKYNRWYSQISINKKNVFLGSFKTEVDAHNAYQDKLKKENFI